MNERRIEATGDREAYRAACAAMRVWMSDLPSRVVLLHHGDGDGILGAALLAAWLGARGKSVSFASRAEFRADDIPFWEEALADAEAAEPPGGIFVEAQGMPESYARFDARCLNIDHHPHPTDTPIRRMLNPRTHGLAPIPCIAHVVWDLLADDLPPRARFFAALGAAVDRCPDPAREILLAEKQNLFRLADLEATFHAVQYASPLPERLAEFLSTLPSPEAILAAEPFAARRKRFARAIEAAAAEAREKKGILFARVAPVFDEAGPPLRIASPLANRLSSRHPDRIVAVAEAAGGMEESDGARLRVSFRAPASSRGFHLGHALAAATGAWPGSDGTGHERAGSARIPSARLEELLARVADADVAESRTAAARS